MFTTTEGSFIRRYGILAMPMIFMMCFGCFGFRPGQLTRGIRACLINFFFFFSFTLPITVLCIILITTKDFYAKDLYVTFMSLVFFCYLIHYILLIYKFYKNYNMYCLFEDVKNVRLNRLSNLQSLKVFFLLFLCLPFIVYLLYSTYVTKDNIWNILTTDPMWTNLLMILHPFLSSTLVYMSVVCLSFMTSVFTIVLEREFDQCNSDLKDKIARDKYLTYQTFIKATKRFNELANVVDKVNEMTCDLVVIALIIVLGSLCITVYATIVNSSQIVGYMVNVCEAILMVILLLPQAILLNEKVKLSNLFVVSPFWGPLIPLFWTYDNLCSGFPSQDRSLPWIHQCACNRFHRFTSGVTPAVLFHEIRNVIYHKTNEKYTYSGSLINNMKIPLMIFLARDAYSIQLLHVLVLGNSNMPVFVNFA